ncbi:hypothetical protein DFJ74DRAFT_119101 [Hyaloraphidium curvatum]|nr:hypothetical protein DFJ74DRAFT_119101 [Hyaloraphidium curvatum]
MISTSASSSSLQMDPPLIEKRTTFGRGHVGRHRFHMGASDANLARPQAEPNSADAGMGLAHEQKPPRPLMPEHSDDGRSELEIPTMVAKLSAVGLNKRDSEATQTDLSRFASVQDFGAHQQQAAVSPGTVDDWVAPTLSATDSGIEILLRRAKQSATSTKIVGDFFQQRANIERTYGRAIQELVRSTLRELESKDGQGKEQTFGSHFRAFLGVHDTIGQNALVLADRVQEISVDSYANAGEVTRRRKACKEANERIAQEMSASLKTLAKAEQKYQLAAQDWEKALHGAELVEIEQGFNTAPTSPLKKPFFKTQSPAEKVRAQVDDAVRKTDAANVSFNVQIAQTNKDRKDYLTQKIPSVIQSLKRAIDDADANLQFSLEKYSVKYEERVMSDATALSPLDPNAPSLKRTVAGIRNDQDLSDYVRGALRTASNGNDDSVEYIPLASEVKNRDVFGETLEAICDREGSDVPYVVRKCTEVIERFAINAPGIYRKNGNPSDVQRLRALFNAVEVDGDVVISDNMVAGENIHVISSALKLFFRELPDPLLTRQLYEGFQQAAILAHDVIRGQQIHDLVNHLPDRNYIVLKHLIRHFLKMCQYQHITKMGPMQLAVVWGTILVGGPIRQPTSPVKTGQAKGSAIDLFGLGPKDQGPAATIQNDAKILEIIIREADKMFDFV